MERERKTKRETMMKDLTNTTSSQVIKENVTVTAHTGNVM